MSDSDFIQGIKTLIKAKASLKIKTVKFSRVTAVRYKGKDWFSWKKYFKAVMSGRFTFDNGKVEVYHPYLFYPNLEYRLLELVGVFPNEAFVILKDAKEATAIKIIYENPLCYTLVD